MTDTRTPPRWNAQLRDALCRRQKELPIALVDAALAIVTPGASDTTLPCADSAFLGAATRDLLSDHEVGSVMFVDGIPDDPRMLTPLPHDASRMLFVAHRVPTMARMLADRLGSWNVASAVHGFAANAAEDLRSPVSMARPALVVLPANVLGARGTVDMVRMLRVVRSMLRSGDRALIVVDLRQDGAALTADFAEPGGAWDLAHRVLVEEFTRLCDDSFDPGNLAFETRFDRANARVEGLLTARKAVTLTLPDGTQVPVARRESLRTVVSTSLDRKRLEGTLRGCALEIRGWVEDVSATAAVALVEPVMHS